VTGLRVKVLILWANSVNAPNLGVRALSEGAAALIKETWGEDTQVAFQDFGAGSSDVSFGKSGVFLELFSGRHPISARLSEFDLIFDTGAGDSFTDIYGLKRTVQVTFAQSRAHRLNIPVVMGPQTIGPFRTRLGRQLGSKSLRRMSVVIARDSASMEASARLGRSADALASDLVFMLPTPEVDKTRDIVLNVSGLLWWRGNAHVDYRRYRKSVYLTIEHLLSEGRGVSLVAHVVGDSCGLTDRRAIDNDVPVLRHLESRFACGSLEAICPSSLLDARRVLSSARLVVGGRMHACLNSISSGTPAIATAYSRKFGPLLRDLGWPHSIDIEGDGEFFDKLRPMLHELDWGRGMDDVVSSANARAKEKLSDAVAALRRLKV